MFGLPGALEWGVLGFFGLIGVGGLVLLVVLNRPKPLPSPQPPPTLLETRLRELQGAKNAGLISEEEFQAQRQQLLNEASKL